MSPIILTLLVKTSLAEPTDKVANTAQETRSTLLLYGGEGRQAALLRAAAATEMEVDKLRLSTTLELSRTKQMSLVGAAFSVCNGTATSNTQLQRMLDRAENAYHYAESERAISLVKSTLSQLPCCTELLPAEFLYQLHLLDGLLKFEAGQKAESKAAYARALSIFPSNQWDPNYSEDSIELFNQAKADLAASDENPLVIIPSSGSADLWINGATVNATSPSIPAVGGVLQYGSLSNGLFVEEQREKTLLMIPAALPLNANNWVHTPEKRTELGQLLGQLTTDERVLVHSQGEIWSLDSTQQTWTQLQVPSRLLKDIVQLTPAQRTGRILQWGGYGVSLAAISYGATQAILAISAAQSASNTQEPQTYRDNQNEYTTSSSQYYFSLGFGIAGFAVGTTGLVLFWSEDGINWLLPDSETQSDSTSALAPAANR